MTTRGRIRKKPLVSYSESGAPHSLRAPHRLSTRNSGIVPVDRRGCTAIVASRQPANK